MSVSMLEPINVDNLYALVYQDENINRFNYITPNALANMDIDQKLDEDGKLELHRNGTVFIFDPCHISVQGRTQQLLLYYIEQFAKVVFPNSSTEEIMQHKTIEMNISDIASDFGLSTKQMRRIVMESSIALQTMIIGWNYNGSDIQGMKTTNILQGVDYAERIGGNDVKRGRIRVTFADVFAKMLPRLFLMWYPKNLRKISQHKNPSSNAFGVKIASYYNLNAMRQKKVDCISVTSLLSVTYEIPKWSDLQKDGSQAFRRIIVPFVRDMDALVQHHVLESWFLIYNGERVQVSDYNTLGYSKFEKCMVHFRFYRHPNDKRSTNDKPAPEQTRQTKTTETEASEEYSDLIRRSFLSLIDSSEEADVVV